MYVDDTLAIFKQSVHINNSIDRLESSSVLGFTSEHMKNNTFNFLDVPMTICEEGNISTSFLLRYKKSVVKSLVYRALKHSSSWHSVHAEI